MRKFLTGVMLTIITVFMSLAHVASADTLDRILKENKIRVGICLTGPPMGYRDAKNNPAGLDYELSQALGAALGVKVEYLEMQGPARIPSLLANKVDVVACNFTASLERAKSISFSIPYLKTGIKIATREDTGIKTITDLDGKKVAVGRGTTNEALVKKYAPKAELAYYDGFTEAFLALEQSKVDAALEDGMMIDYLAGLKDDVISLNEVYTSDPIALGVRNDDANFVRFLDMFVSEYINSGKLHEAYERLWGTPYTGNLTTSW